MGEVEIGRTLLLWFWALCLAGIEIEIEGGYGWAERLPTWWLRRGAVGRVYGVFMGHRPLTGYHVFAFTIPLLVLHLPFVMGVDWTLAGELRVFATYFALAVVWDYLWFVLNPAYTVRRFHRGRVWWFEVPWIWRFPLDYYSGIALSIALGALAAVAAGDGGPLWRELWMLAGLAVLTAIAVALAPFYHRWYRHMRRAGADDRGLIRTYPPPAPDEAWAGGVPDLPPLAGQGALPPPPTPASRVRSGAKEAD
jgi:hypothetical protein